MALETKGNTKFATLKNPQPGGDTQVDPVVARAQALAANFVSRVDSRENIGTARQNMQTRAYKPQEGYLANFERETGQRLSVERPEEWDGQYEDYMYQKDNWFDDAYKATAGSLTQFAAGFLDSLGGNDPRQIYETFSGDHEAFGSAGIDSNFINQWAKSLREYSDENFRIFTDRNNDGSRFWTPEYWTTQVQNLGYSMGIGAEMIAEGLAMAALTETGVGSTVAVPAAASRVAKWGANAAKVANILSKGLRSTGTAANWVGRSAMWGVYQGAKESTMNARETQETVYNDLVARGVDPETALIEAAQAGTNRARAEVIPTMMLNGLQFGLLGGIGRGARSIKNPFSMASNAGTSFQYGVSGLADNFISPLTKGITSTALRRGTEMSAQMLAEGVEEFVQEFWGNHYRYHALKNQGVDDPFKTYEYEVFNEHLTDAAIGGALGGLGFYGIGKAGNRINRYLNKDRIAQEEKEKKDFLSGINGMYSRVQSAINNTIDRNDPESVARASRMANAHNVRTAMRHDYRFQTTDGFDSYLSMLDSVSAAIENQDKAALESLGVSENVTVEDVKAWREQAMQMKKDIVDEYNNTNDDFEIAMNQMERKHAIANATERLESLTKELEALEAKTGVNAFSEDSNERKLIAKRSELIKAQREALLDEITKEENQKKMMESTQKLINEKNEEIKAEGKPELTNDQKAIIARTEERKFIEGVKYSPEIQSRLESLENEALELEAKLDPSSLSAVNAFQDSSGIEYQDAITNHKEFVDNTQADYNKFSDKKYQKTWREEQVQKQIEALKAEEEKIRNDKNLTKRQKKDAIRELYGKKKSIFSRLSSWFDKGKKKNDASDALEADARRREDENDAKAIEAGVSPVEAFTEEDLDWAEEEFLRAEEELTDEKIDELSDEDLTDDIMRFFNVPSEMRPRIQTMVESSRATFGDAISKYLVVQYNNVQYTLGYIVAHEFDENGDIASEIISRNALIGLEQASMQENGLSFSFETIMFNQRDMRVSMISAQRIQELTELWEDGQNVNEEFVDDTMSDNADNAALMNSGAMTRLEELGLVLEDNDDYIPILERMVAVKNAMGLDSYDFFQLDSDDNSVFVNMPEGTTLEGYNSPKSIIISQDQVYVHIENEKENRDIEVNDFSGLKFQVNDQELINSVEEVEELFHPDLKLPELDDKAEAVYKMIEHASRLWQSMNPNSGKPTLYQVIQILESTKPGVLNALRDKNRFAEFVRLSNLATERRTQPGEVPAYITDEYANQTYHMLTGSIAQVQIVNNANPTQSVQATEEERRGPRRGIQAKENKVTIANLPMDALSPGVNTAHLDDRRLEGETHLSAIVVDLSLTDAPQFTDPLLSEAYKQALDYAHNNGMQHGDHNHPILLVNSKGQYVGMLSSSVYADMNNVQHTNDEIAKTRANIMELDKQGKKISFRIDEASNRGYVSNSQNATLEQMLGPSDKVKNAVTFAVVTEDGGLKYYDKTTGKELTMTSKEYSLVSKNGSQELSSGRQIMILQRRGADGNMENYVLPLKVRTLNAFEINIILNDLIGYASGTSSVGFKQISATVNTYAYIPTTNPSQASGVDIFFNLADGNKVYIKVDNEYVPLDTENSVHLDTINRVVPGLYFNMNIAQMENNIKVFPMEYSSTEGRFKVIGSPISYYDHVFRYSIPTSIVRNVGTTESPFLSMAAYSNTHLSLDASELAVQVNPTSTKTTDGEQAKKEQEDAKKRAQDRINESIASAQAVLNRIGTFSSADQLNVEEAWNEINRIQGLIDNINRNIEGLVQDEIEARDKKAEESEIKKIVDATLSLNEKLHNLERQKMEYDSKVEKFKAETKDLTARARKFEVGDYSNNDNQDPNTPEYYDERIAYWQELLNGVERGIGRIDDATRIHKDVMGLKAPHGTNPAKRNLEEQKKALQDRIKTEEAAKAKLNKSKGKSSQKASDATQNIESDEERVNKILSAFEALGFVIPYKDNHEDIVKAIKEQIEMTGNGLTELQHRALSNYIFHFMASESAKDEADMIKKVHESMSKYLKAIIDAHNDALEQKKNDSKHAKALVILLRENIDNLTEENSESIKSAIREQREVLKSLTGGRYNYDSNLESIRLDDFSYDESNKAVHARESMSSGVRAILAGIERKNSEGRPILGILGLPQYVSIVDAYNVTEMFLTYPNDLPSSETEMFNRLSEASNYYPFMSDVKNRLENSDQQVKNAFLYLFTKNYTNPLKIQSNSEVSDGRVKEVASSNPIMRTNDKFAQGMLAKLTETKEGVIQFNYTQAIEELQELKHRLKDESDITADDIKSYFEVVGIDIHPKTAESILTSGLRLRLASGAVKNMDARDFIMRKNDAITTMLNRIQGQVTEKQVDLGLFLSAIKSTRDMFAVAERQALITSDSFTSTYVDGDKRVSMLSYTRMSKDQVNKLKDDGVYRGQLARTAYAGDSLWLKAMSIDPLAYDREYEGLYETLRLFNLEPMAVESYSLSDQHYTYLTTDQKTRIAIDYYMSMVETDKTLSKLNKAIGMQGAMATNLEFRFGRWVAPTMSDKKQAFVMEVPMIAFDETSMASQINLGYEYAYEYGILPELKRILSVAAEQRQGNDMNTYKVENAFKLIYIMPSLNALEIEREGMKMNLIEYLSKVDNNDVAALLAELKKPIIDHMKAEIEGQVAKIKGNMAYYRLFDITDQELAEAGSDLEGNRSYSEIVSGKNGHGAIGFFINSIVNMQNMHQTIIGDPAFFAKSDKDMIGKSKDDPKPFYLDADKNLVWNTDANMSGEQVASLMLNTSFTNLGKRMGMMTAQGSKIANSRNDKYIQLMIEDQQSMTTNFSYLVDMLKERVNAKDKAFLNGDEVKEMLGKLNSENQDEVDQAVNFFKKNDIFKSISGFLENETSDAQEYTTLSEHIDILFGQGRLSDKKYEAIKKKIERQMEAEANGKEVTNDMLLSRSDLNAILQPIKSVVTGTVYDEKTNMMRPVYVKSSSYPLIPQLTAGMEIDKLRRMMEKIQRRRGQNVRASYGTANKVGGVKNHIELWNKDGSFIDQDLTDAGMDKIVADHALELPRDNFRIQLDVPEHEDYVSIMTQIQKLLFGNGVIELDGFEFNGEKYSGRELYERYKQSFSDLIEVKKIQLMQELGIGPKGNLIGDGKVFKRAIKKIILDKLNEDGASHAERSIVGRVVNGIKYVPKSNSFYFEDIDFSNLPDANKYMEILMSYINKRIFNIKLPGYSFVAASERGYIPKKHSSDLTNEVKSRIVWLKDVDGRLQSTHMKDGKLMGAQILIPNKLRDKNGRLIEFVKADGTINELYVARDENTGRLTLKEGMVNSEIFKRITVRIPTSSHVSTANVEVVGILPPEAGDLIIVPDSMTTQKGLDFDIDKEYTYNYYIDVKEDGKIVKFTTERNVSELYNDEGQSRYLGRNGTLMGMLKKYIANEEPSAVPSELQDDPSYMWKKGSVYYASPSETAGTRGLIHSEAIAQVKRHYDGNINPYKLDMDELSANYKAMLESDVIIMYDNDKMLPVARAIALENEKPLYIVSKNSVALYNLETLRDDNINEFDVIAHGRVYTQSFTGTKGKNIKIKDLIRDALYSNDREGKAERFKQHIEKNAYSYATEYDFSRADKDVLFELERSLKNDIVGIHFAVISNSDPSMQKLMAYSLSMDFARSQVDLLSKDSTGVHVGPYALDYQVAKSNLGYVGKEGISIYSSAVVQTALLQTAAANGQFVAQGMESNPVFIQFDKNTQGKIEFSRTGIASRYDTLYGGRSIAEVLGERQNTATDNEKEQIMGRLNVNKTTIAVDVTAAMYGLDKAIVDNNGEMVEVSLGYLMTMLPDITHILMSFDEVISSRKKGYGPRGNKIVMARDRNLTGITMNGNAIDPNEYNITDDNSISKFVNAIANIDNIPVYPLGNKLTFSSPFTDKSIPEYVRNEAYKLWLTTDNNDLVQIYDIDGKEHYVDLNIEPQKRKFIRATITSGKLKGKTILHRSVTDSNGVRYNRDTNPSPAMILSDAINSTAAAVSAKDVDVYAAHAISMLGMNELSPHEVNTAILNPQDAFKAIKGDESYDKPSLAGWYALALRLYHINKEMLEAASFVNIQKSRMGKDVKAANERVAGFNPTDNMMTGLSEWVRDYGWSDMFLDAAKPFARVMYNFSRSTEHSDIPISQMNSWLGIEAFTEQDLSSLAVANTVAKNIMRRENGLRYDISSLVSSLNGNQSLARFILRLSANKDLPSRIKDNPMLKRVRIKDRYGYEFFTVDQTGSAYERMEIEDGLHMLMSDSSIVGEWNGMKISAKDLAELMIDYSLVFGSPGSYGDFTSIVPESKFNDRLAGLKRVEVMSPSNMALAFVRMLNDSSAHARIKEARAERGIAKKVEIDNGVVYVNRKLAHDGMTQEAIGLGIVTEPEGSPTFFDNIEANNELYGNYSSLLNHILEDELSSLDTNNLPKSYYKLSGMMALEISSYFQMNMQYLDGQIKEGALGMTNVKNGTITIDEDKARMHGMLGSVSSHEAIHFAVESAFKYAYGQDASQGAYSDVFSPYIYQIESIMGAVEAEYKKGSHGLSSNAIQLMEYVLYGNMDQKIRTREFVATVLGNEEIAGWLTGIEISDDVVYVEGVIDSIAGQLNKILRAILDLIFDMVTDNNIGLQNAFHATFAVSMRYGMIGNAVASQQQQATDDFQDHNLVDQEEDNLQHINFYC